ncbi:MAG TPA: condensation domain-containing protein, partial [Symbiobacteriaceae bacterium]|nr:condensation domain-containing protein [Symbiobacteriaceae bacterium]
MKLAEFYERLELQVRCRPAADQELERLAHITQRTADFHLTGAPLTEGDLRDAIARGASCWAIEITDRFDDYGLSGLLLFHQEGDVLAVDSFVLTCRVMGKNAETEVLRQLADHARNAVRFTCHPTPRNGVAQSFIRRIGAGRLSESQDGLAALIPVTDLQTPPAQESAVYKTQSPRLTQSRRIATEPLARYTSGEAIMLAVKERQRLTQPAQTTGGAGFTAPRKPTEGVLAAIWCDLLNLKQVSIHDHFLRLGGHSLLATQLASRIRDAWKVELPLVTLFEAPTIATMAERIEAARLQQDGLAVPPIVPVPREDAEVLSFSQQRLWFLDQLEPGSLFYHMPAAIRLNGELNLPALERAIGEIISRHAVLRTTFATRGAEPVQVIHPAGEFQLPIIAAQSEAEVEQLAAAETKIPFDLSRGPLLRCRLLRLAPERHVLLLTLHHIAADGWSIAILMQELTALYTAFSSGREHALPPLPVQYADFAHWQRNLGPVLEKQLAYWRQQLAGLSTLQLPTDRPRPLVQSYRGARRAFRLDDALTAAIKQVSAREGVTPFMTLLAVFQILLHRCTGQEDVAVGTPIAGRNRAETERLVGMFINTLVMRTDLSGNPTVRQVLARVRDVTLGAYAHQDLPFEKLVEELQPQRDLGRNPLVQVMFFLLNTPAVQPELPGLSMEVVRTEGATAKFDIDLFLEEDGGELQGHLEYNTDLFEAATVEQLISHFQTLLAAAVADPETKVADLPLLTDVERAELKTRTNPVQVTTPYVPFEASETEQSIGERFEAMVRQLGARTALVAPSGTMTYDELNRAVNRLA